MLVYSVLLSRSPHNVIFLIKNILIVKFARNRRLDIVRYVTKNAKLIHIRFLLHNSSDLEEISNARKENNKILSFINRKTGEIRPTGETNIRETDVNKMSIKSHVFRSKEKKNKFSFGNFGSVFKAPLGTNTSQLLQLN